jgi:hypothetical protein
VTGWWDFEGVDMRNSDDDVHLVVSASHSKQHT